MIKELSTELKAALYERVKAPVMGAYVLSWVIWNWSALALLFFGSNEVDVRIENFQNYLLIPSEDGSRSSIKYSVFLYPFIPLVLFITILPLFEILAFTYKEFVKSLGLKAKEKFDKKLRLTLEESNKIRDEISDKFKHLNEISVKKDNEISDLQIKISNKDENINSLQQSLSDRNSSIDKTQEQLNNANNEIIKLSEKSSRIQSKINKTELSIHSLKQFSLYQTSPDTVDNILSGCLDFHATLIPPIIVNKIIECHFYHEVKYIISTAAIINKKFIIYEEDQQDIKILYDAVLLFFSNNSTDIVKKERIEIIELFKEIDPNFYKSIHLDKDLFSLMGSDISESITGL